MWRAEFLDQVREEAEKSGVATADILQDTAVALSDKLRRLTSEQGC